MNCMYNKKKNLARALLRPREKRELEGIPRSGSSRGGSPLELGRSRRGGAGGGRFRQPPALRVSGTIFDSLRSKSIGKGVLQLRASDQESLRVSSGVRYRAKPKI